MVALMAQRHALAEQLARLPELLPLLGRLDGALDQLAKGTHSPRPTDIGHSLIDSPLPRWYQRVARAALRAGTHGYQRRIVVAPPAAAKP